MTASDIARIPGTERTSGVPLAILEWYFRTQRGVGEGESYLFAGTLLGLTLFMGLGIFAATAGMWMPRMYPGA